MNIFAENFKIQHMKYIENFTKSKEKDRIIYRKICNKIIKDRCQDRTSNFFWQSTDVAYYYIIERRVNGYTDTIDVITYKEINNRLKNYERKNKLKKLLNKKKYESN